MRDNQDKLLCDIKNEILNRQRTFDNSLMSGSCGRILFLAHYFLFTGDFLIKRALYDLIENVASDLNNLGSSICTGPAGIGWSFLHLQEIGILDFEDDDVLSSIDQQVILATQEQLESKNFDFLHGALGQGLYLLKRTENADCTKSLTEIVHQLDKSKIETEDGIYWEDFNFTENRSMKRCNLGLAHGMPGFLMFLSKCLKAKILPEIVLHLLDGCFKNLIRLKSKSMIKDSYFEPWVDYSAPERKVGSRLGWCYGDLTIGLTLLNTQSDDYYVKCAIEMIAASSQRKDYASTRINNEFICHGSSGVAYIFHRCGEITGQKGFYEASSYWFNNLKEHLHENIHQYPDGLLEGIDGIGLCILGIQGGFKHQSWDECLLLR